MPDGTPEHTAHQHTAHQHTGDCRALFREWLRYDLVAGDVTGRFHPDDRAAATRERAMFERQLRALGCTPEALLAEWRAAEEGAADED